MLCDRPVTGLVMLSFCLCRHSTLRKTSCCVTVHGLGHVCPSVCDQTLFVSTLRSFSKSVLMLCDLSWSGHVVLLFV